MRAVYFSGAVEVCETLFRGDQVFVRDSGEDAFFGHDEAIAFVEEIVAPDFRGSQIDRDEVCAGAKAAAIAAAGLGEVQSADGGNDPIRTHEAQGRHTVQCEIDVGDGTVGQGSFFAGNKWTDAAAVDWEIGGE